LGTIRYTKYLNQCLEELERAAEYEADSLAVQLVRLQHLTEKVFHFHTKDQLLSELASIPKPTTTQYLEAFQTELASFWEALPPSLKNNRETILYVDAESHATLLTP
jgi:hypothetical protein